MMVNMQCWYVGQGVEHTILALILIFTNRLMDHTVVDDTRTKGIEQVKEEYGIGNGGVFEASNSWGWPGLVG